VLVVTENIERYCDCYTNGDASYKERVSLFTLLHNEYSPYSRFLCFSSRTVCHILPTSFLHRVSTHMPPLFYPTKLLFHFLFYVLPHLSPTYHADNIRTVCPVQFRADNVCPLSFVHAFRYRVPSLSMFHVCRMRPLFSRYFVFSFTYALASVIVFPLAKPRFNTEKLLTLCSCFFYTECSEENVSNFRISSHKSYSKEVLYRRMLVYPCTHQ